MSDLLAQIQQAQRDAAERVVIADLEARGLVAGEASAPQEPSANRPPDVAEFVVDILCRMNEAPGPHIRESWKVEIRRAIVALRTDLVPTGPATTELTRSQKLTAAGFTRRPSVKTAGGLMREEDARTPDLAFHLRIARLLAELHGDATLSEQQCARYMGIDLVSWRKLEHCFSAGTSFIEGGDDDFPVEDSESVLRAALARGMEARQGRDPKGLDGEATTARPEGTRPDEHPQPPEHHPQEGGKT